MRRVNIITGIKQRFNDILGYGEDGELTAWSIQSAMLDNLTLLAKAVAGYSPNGRVISGMVVERIAFQSFNMSPGLAVASLGHIVTLQNNVTFKIPASGTNYIYVKYSTRKLTTATIGRGQKSTTVANDPELKDIVYDETGMALGLNVTSDDIVVVSSDPPHQSSMLAHVATISASNVVTPTIYQGPKALNNFVLTNDAGTISKIVRLTADGSALELI